MEVVLEGCDPAPLGQWRFQMALDGMVLLIKVTRTFKIMIVIIIIISLIGHVPYIKPMLSDIIEKWT